jgi:translation initiation factor 2 subunit 2
MVVYEAIKNRLQAKHVESLFVKYIKEFVRCQPCGSQNTLLEKDKQTRLEQLQCQACKATRRVAQIKKRG